MRLAACLLVLISFGPWGCTQSTKPPKETKAQRDAAVLEAALQDLRSYRGKDALYRSDEAIRFDFSPRTRTGTNGDPFSRTEEFDEKWKALPDAQRAGAEAAVKQIAARIAQKDFVSPFVPKSRGIIISGGSSNKSGRGLEDRPVTANPPGYSADGKFAVVLIVAPWSMHHADVVYMLERTSDRWVVRLRHNVIYP